MERLPADLLRTDLDLILEVAREPLLNLKNARLFLTGGTGFFGKWLLGSLLWANHRLDLGVEVVVLTRDPVRFATRHPELARDAAVELLAGDVRDFSYPAGTFTHVIHAATDTSVAAAGHPGQLLATIIDGTRRVLDFARDSGARQVLLTSSGAVYGVQPADLEHMPESYTGAPDPTDLRSTYGIGKRTAEQMCTIAWHEHGLETKIARCFAFVGSYLPLDAHFAIGNFIRDALQEERIVVKSDGRPRRSYLYAADLTAWLWTILVHGAPATAYNVGSDQGVSVGDLARHVGAVLAPNRPVDILGTVTGGPRDAYVPDISRARSLGLEVWTPLTEAVRRTADWYRERPAQLAAAAPAEAVPVAVTAAKPRTFVVDVDGVVATITPDNNYRQCQPIPHVIEAINRLYDQGHRIVMMTARGSATGIDWSEVTRGQFAAWGLKFHELRFGKPAADYYVDDRLITVEMLSAMAAGRPFPPNTRAPGSQHHGTISNSS